MIKLGTLIICIVGILMTVLAGATISMVWDGPYTYRGEKSNRVILTLAVLILSVGVVAAIASAREVYADAAEAEMAAVELYDLGLITGTGEDEDGNVKFAMKDTVTRAEAVTMLVRMLGAENDSRYDLNLGEKYPFNDTNNWVYQYARYAYMKGIVKGISEKEFGAKELITESGFLTMTLRALGYEDVDYTDPYPLADEVGLAYSVPTSKVFQRSDMFLICQSALDCQINEKAYTMREYLIAKGAIPSESNVAELEILEESAEGEMHMRVDSLGEFMQAIYTAVRAKAGVVEIELPEGAKESYEKYLRDNRSDIFSELYAKVFLGDSPSTLRIQLYYSDAGAVMRYLETLDDEGNSLQTLTEKQQELLERAQEIVAEIPEDASDYEKVTYIHDWLIENNEYDLEAANKGSAVSSILNGRTVCSGFSQGFDLLCYLSGIDCICVVGNSCWADIFGVSDTSLHEWNKVLIDGEWYNLDVTWDNRDGEIVYDNFLIGDEEFSEGHAWDQYPGMPVAEKNYELVVEEDAGAVTEEEESCDADDDVTDILVDPIEELENDALLLTA